jgi:hypothetical protein
VEIAKQRAQAAATLAMKKQAGTSRAISQQQN